jgi:F0F1-type ATP synthase assembly protein I
MTGAAPDPSSQSSQEPKVQDERGNVVPKRDTQSSDFARVIREAAPYLGLGTALAMSVGLLVALGFWLDGLMGTSPAMALAFGLLGVVVALVQFVRMASNLNKPKT